MIDFISPMFYDTLSCLLLLLLFIYLTLTEVKIFTIKNIYIAVVIPLNDTDGMLIKASEKKFTKKNKVQ